MTGSLASRAEAALRSLRVVDAVRVIADGDRLTEIHVESSSNRSPKLIARDIENKLINGLNLKFDRRIISVALIRATASPAPTPSTDGHGANPAILDGRAVTALGGGSAAPAAVEAEDPVVPRDERILFENVNLIVHGQRTQAQVELRWKGLPRIGNASGYGTRDESHRLVAQATTLAVQELLEDPVALDVREVGFCEVAGIRVAVVAIALLAHRSEKLLTGSCSVGSDTPQAVVLATLAALNRVVAGMKAKEPVEYVLRSETYTDS